MLEKITKKHLIITVLAGGLLLLSLLLAQFFYYKSQKSKLVEENLVLIEKIKKLSTQVEERDKYVKLLEKSIQEKKTEIIEKEKIVYKEGKIQIPKDYEELKENYLILDDINYTQKQVISALEEKSKLDDVLIQDLASSLKEAQIQLEKSNNFIQSKKLFEHQFLVGTDMKSVDANYIITIKERVSIGIGYSTDLKVRAYVGVKL